MATVTALPVRLLERCQLRNNGLKARPAREVQCPRIGTCMCIPLREQLVIEIERAQDALARYDAENKR